MVLEVAKLTAIETEFSDITLYPGKYIINIHKKESIDVKVLSGFAVFAAAGKKHSLKLEPGYELDVSKVREGGWFQFGFPRPANYRVVLENLAAAMDIQKDEYFKLARKFRPVAKKAVEQMSSYYSEFTARRIASHKARLLRIKQRRERIYKMNAELRSMFRKENYLE